METLRFDRCGDVGWLRLARPDQLNAQNALMWDELIDLQRHLDSPGGAVRALVVAGTGRAFSAGIDLGEIDPSAGRLLRDAATSGGDGPDPLLARIAAVQSAFRWFRDTPIPTLAAVHGYALGAGFQLALACDLRVFAAGTLAGLLEFRHGLLPDLGATAYLPGIVGEGRARELIFTARIVDSEEAARIGLANEIVSAEDLEAHAGTLAEALARAPALAVRHTKAALAVAADVGASLERACVGQAACLRALAGDRLQAVPGGP
jgi:enoyl-CoA hydratase/carnithine racemase